MSAMRLLSATSIAALLLTGSAFAQSPAPQSGGGAMQKSEPAAPSSMDRGSAMDKSAPKGAETAPSKAPAQTTTQRDMPAKAGDSKMSNDTKTGTDSKMSSDSKSGASKTTTGSASASGNLTVEQKTEIRQTVLTANAPRVTNVNFSINVGTVVPSSVRVVEVPATIIRIHPEWRGYRYFVVNDEIIIVEPGSLKIVAVLNV